MTSKGFRASTRVAAPGIDVLAFRYFIYLVQWVWVRTHYDVTLFCTDLPVEDVRLVSGFFVSSVLFFFFFFFFSSQEA